MATAEQMWMKVWGALGEPHRMPRAYLPEIARLDPDFAARCVEEMKRMYESQMQDVAHFVRRGNPDHPEAKRARAIADDCEFIRTELVRHGARPAR